MDNRPIGVFDSGLGGLTTVLELKKILPNENIIYFGDTGRIPYGTRSREIIKKYALQDINFLLSKNVKFIIAACGTASSVLSTVDINHIGIEYTGVIIPTAQKAASVTVSKKIGVIGTSATIKSLAYESALGAISNDISVFGVACPLFVPLVENGFTNIDNQVTRLVCEQYLSPLKQAGIDTLILGCTHYPILKDIITLVMGPDVTLINSGQEAARASLDLLQEKAMLSLSNASPICEFYISDTIEDWNKNVSTILDEPITGSVHKIDIEQY